MKNQIAVPPMASSMAGIADICIAKPVLGRTIAGVDASHEETANTFDIAFAVGI